MTRDEFERRLIEATTYAIDFARDFVSDALPNSLRYYLLLNQSNDRHSTEAMVLYPEDDGIILSHETAGEVVSTIYREGRCPVWIDISVRAIEGHETCIQLLCAGRYVTDDNLLYHRGRSTYPFSVKSPPLPPGHDRAQKFLLPRKWSPPTYRRGQK